MTKFVVVKSIFFLLISLGTMLYSMENEKKYQITEYDNDRDRKAVDSIIETYPEYLYSQALAKPVDNPSNCFKKSDTIVLRVNDGTVGFLNYHANKFDLFSLPIINDGSINYLGIDKNFQGNGYGKILLEHGIENLKKQEVSSIHLSVKSENKAARALYEKLGFQLVGESNTGNMLYKLKAAKGNIIQEHPKATLAILVAGISIGLTCLKKG